jgi:hypothetical protein
MNQALSRCSPPSNIADLMSLLSTNRASRDKSKSFFESFGISYDVSKANGRRTREGRSSQFGNFFSRRLINIYERVFKNVANLQVNMQILVDKLKYNLTISCFAFTWTKYHTDSPTTHARKSEAEKENVIRIPNPHNLHIEIKTNVLSVCQPLTTFIHFHLNFLRQFLTRLGNYMFEEVCSFFIYLNNYRYQSMNDQVLLLESAKILGAIQRETDPHGLLCQHENQLSTIMRALFIYSGAAPVSEILLATIRNGRAFVDAGKSRVLGFLERKNLTDYD